jgi:hypothetical protein
MSKSIDPAIDSETRKWAGWRGGIHYWLLPGNGDDLDFFQFF